MLEVLRYIALNALNTVQKIKTMSKMSKIDQIHLRAVMLCMSKMSKMVSGYHADTPITIKAEPFIWPTAAFINIHEHPI